MKMENSILNIVIVTHTKLIVINIYKLLICLLAFFGHLYSESDDIIIRNIILRGNENVSLGEVLSIVRQRPPYWLYRRIEFDSRLVKLDALTIKNLYHSKGFLDVAIKESVKLDGSFADIEYEIYEGKQYFINNIILEGNKLVSSETIKSLLNLYEDQPYNPVYINDNLYLIENQYHNIGKLFFSIQIIDEITDSVNVKIIINEGKDIYINNTFYEKIGSIDTILVQREITYKKGDLYTKSEIDFTNRRIKEMGIFSMVNMVPVKVLNSDSLVNIVIEFRRFKQREWNSVGGYDPIQFAEGAEPIPAWNATIEWMNRSFFNTPTHFSTKLLFGVPAEVEFVLPRIRYDISFGSNWFFGIRFPSKLTGYFETFIEYKEKIETIKRYGIDLSQQFKFENRSYFETNTVLESFSDQSEFNSNIQQRSFRIKFNIDRKDDPLFPKNGFLVSGILKSTGYFFGGERDYLKADITYQTYFPIIKNNIFAGRIKAGRIWGWDSSFNDYSYEKFYLGGSTSMRGWDVLRFKENNDNPKGEIIRIMTNLELRIPIYKAFGLTFFSDGGILAQQTRELQLDNLKWDSGIGINIITPLGPIRLDYAFQLDNMRIWKFQMGVQNLF